AHPHGRLLRLPLPGGLETEGGGRVAGARGRQPPPRPAFSARSSGGGPDRLERMNASLVSRLFGPSRPLSTRPNAEGQRTGLKRVKSGVNVVLLNGGCAASRKESLVPHNHIHPRHLRDRRHRERRGRDRQAAQGSDSVRTAAAVCERPALSSTYPGEAAGDFQHDLQREDRDEGDQCAVCSKIITVNVIRVVITV